MPAALTFERFREALARGAVEPVYLLEGDELFFHEEAIRLLEAAVPASGAMDRDVLQGDEASIAAVLDLAATYAMGGGRRLVVVRRADALRLPEGDALAAYLRDPNPRSCLVFSDTAFDRRRTLYRVLSAGAARIDCAPLDEARAAVWVRERLRGRGYGISADLAEAIAAGLAGAPLARVAAEIEKLMSAIGAPRPVEPGDLAILADVPRVDDVFRIAAQAVRGERGEAVAGVRALLRQGEEPVRLLGALSWYFRNALKAAAAATRRLPPREVIALYGIDPGRLARLRSETGGAGVGAMREALALCLRTDRELKGGGARDPRHALERLVHEVGLRAGRRP